VTDVDSLKRKKIEDKYVTNFLLFRWSWYFIRFISSVFSMFRWWINSNSKMRLFFSSSYFYQSNLALKIFCFNQHIRIFFKISKDLFKKQNSLFSPSKIKWKYLAQYAHRRNSMVRYFESVDDEILNWSNMIVTTRHRSSKSLVINIKKQFCIWKQIHLNGWKNWQKPK
jgi:hypothetical protein